MSLTDTMVGTAWVERNDAPATFKDFKNLYPEETDENKELVPLSDKLGQGLIPRDHYIRLILNGQLGSETDIPFTASMARKYKNSLSFESLKQHVINLETEIRQRSSKGFSDYRYSLLDSTKSKDLNEQLKRYFTMLGYSYKSAINNDVIEILITW